MLEIKQVPSKYLFEWPHEWCYNHVLTWTLDNKLEHISGGHKTSKASRIVINKDKQQRDRALINQGLIHALFLCLHTSLWGADVILSEKIEKYRD